MTAEEMHISVNLGVQKIASFQVDNLLPQEIDHELNVAMDKFIKLRYSPFGNKYRDGFEQSQKRIDDLRNLVVDYKSQAFNAGTTVNNYVIDRVPLPIDYMFLVSVFIEEYYKCNVLADWIINTYQDIKYIKVPLVSNGSPLVDILQDGDTTIFQDLQEGQVLDTDYFKSPNFSISDYSVLDSQLSINDYLSDLPITTSFESSPTIDSNHVLIAGDLPTDSVYDAKYQNGDTLTLNPVLIEIRRRQPEDPDTAAIGNEMASYVQHDDLYTILSDPFNKPTYDKVKYTIQENFIDFYTDNTFLVNLANIKYIRYPKRINIIEGTGCELPEHTHQEIVEMAVKGILESIQDPRYQSQSNEVLESE